MIKIIIRKLNTLDVELARGRMILNQERLPTTRGGWFRFNDPAVASPLTPSPNRDKVAEEGGREIRNKL